MNRLPDSESKQKHLESEDTAKWTSILSKFRSLNDSVRAILLKAGLRTKPIKYSEKKSENLIPSEVLIAIQYLESIKANECRAWEIAYAQVPPETWARYENLGIEDLTEQRMLEEAISALHTAWQKRPPILSRKVLE